MMKGVLKIAAVALMVACASRGWAQGGGPLNLQPLGLPPLSLSQRALPGQPQTNQAAPGALTTDRNTPFLGPPPIITPVYVQTVLVNDPKAQPQPAPIIGPSLTPLTGPFAIGGVAPPNLPSAQTTPPTLPGLAPLTLPSLNQTFLGLKLLAPSVMGLPYMSLDRPLPPPSNPPTMIYGPSERYYPVYLNSPVLSYTPTPSPQAAPEQTPTYNAAVGALNVLGRFAGYAGPIR